MKSYFFVLIFALFFFSSALAFLNEDSFQYFQRYSSDPFDVVQAVALDESSGILYAGVDLSERTSVALNVFDLQSKQILNSVTIPGLIQTHDLVLTDAGNLFGLYKKNKFVIMHLPNGFDLQEGRTAPEEIFNGWWTYRGLEFYNGNLITLNETWDHLTAINVSTGKKKHFPNSKLTNIVDFSIAPDGTMVALRGESQELLVFQLTSTSLNLIQKINFVPKEYNYYVDNALAVSVQKDAFFVGTFFGAVETFPRKADGFFETTPSQRVFLSSNPYGQQLSGLNVTSNRLAVAFSNDNPEVTVATLTVPAVSAQEPEPIVPSLAEKAAGITESIGEADPQEALPKQEIIEPVVSPESAGPDSNNESGFPAEQDLNAGLVSESGFGLEEIIVSAEIVGQELGVCFSSLELESYGALELGVLDEGFSLLATINAPSQEMPFDCVSLPFEGTEGTILKTNNGQSAYLEKYGNITENRSILSLELLAMDDFFINIVARGKAVLRLAGTTEQETSADSSELIEAADEMMGVLEKYNLYDFTCPEAITEISIVLKKAFVCEIDATICTEELMVVQEELWALDRKEKSCEQAIQGIATALDFALISYPELKEIPKTLSFGRLLDSETLKEFPGLTVNPVTDFDLELEHIDPFRRLFLVVSKENEKMNCDLLATAITTDFGSEEDSPLRIDSLSEEEIAVLTGTGSLESLSTKEDFISAFRAFAGTTGLDGKIPISNPGFLILSGTGEDFIVSDAIEKNRFEGSRIFLSVPGYEFRKGDALRMRFVPDKTKDWKGEKLVFTACQFEEYFTDSNTPRMFHWIDPVFSDQTVIQFGIPEGELLVDYLLHLNKRFVQQLFSVETISNQNAIKIEVTENGVPIKALPAKNDTESFNPSICLKGIAGHPTLNKLTEKLQVIAENAKQKYLVGTVQTAGAIAGLCVNPLPTAVELLKGANTRFKIVGFKKAVAGEKETPITLGKTELPAKPPATLPLAKEELSLEQVKQKAVSRSCVNLRSDVVKSDGGIDYLKLASLRQSVVFLPDLEIASITVVDDKHSPGNTLYHFVAFEGPCVYSWDIATQNDVAGNLLTEGAVVDFYGKVHVLSALDFPSLVETRFSFKPLFVVKNS